MFDRADPSGGVDHNSAGDHDGDGGNAATDCAGHRDGDRHPELAAAVGPDGLRSVRRQ
ncbi:hypothetical protein GCM10010533_06520 [Mycolicibacterium pallens]